MRKAKVESQSLTCANPKCRRVFANPIIVEDLSLNETGPYQACPYCLTELAVEGIAEAEAEDEELEKGAKTQASERIEKRELKLTPESLTDHGCSHHFGYLSERSKSEGIPEECMTCDRIVQCMLKKVTS